MRFRKVLHWTVHRWLRFFIALIPAWERSRGTDPLRLLSSHLPRLKITLPHEGVPLVFVYVCARACVKGAYKFIHSRARWMTPVKLTRQSKRLPPRDRLTPFNLLVLSSFNSRKLNGKFHAVKANRTPCTPETLSSLRFYLIFSDTKWQRGTWAGEMRSSRQKKLGESRIFIKHIARSSWSIYRSTIISRIQLNLLNERAW